MWRLILNGKGVKMVTQGDGWELARIKIILEKFIFGLKDKSGSNSWDQVLRKVKGNLMAYIKVSKMAWIVLSLCGGDLISKVNLIAMI